MANEEEWRPPFNGRLIDDVPCPACEAEAIMVREDSSEDPRPAYCDACHVNLVLEVYEHFGEPRVVE